VGEGTAKENILKYITAMKYVGFCDMDSLIENL